MTRLRGSVVLASGFTALGLLGLGAVEASPASLLGAAGGVTACLLLWPLPVLATLRFRRPPTTAFMLRTMLALRRQPGAGDRVTHCWVDYGRISVHMRAAALAGEDVYFPLHDGFDWASIRAALRESRNGGRQRGASTISQQLAKNLFLWPSRSYVRKAVEAYLTVFVEAILGKRRILEIYLNVVQFDAALFGVEAAARRFFAKAAADLSRQEAALLAAVLPNPILYQVRRPCHLVRFRQAMILATMNKLSPDYLALVEAGRGGQP
jgi:monofunctional biosynthetic peptidoglycan transglycosylase